MVQVRKRKDGFRLGKGNSFLGSRRLLEIRFAEITSKGCNLVPVLLGGTWDQALAELLFWEIKLGAVQVI